MKRKYINGVKHIEAISMGKWANDDGGDGGGGKYDVPTDTSFNFGTLPSCSGSVPYIDTNSSEFQASTRWNEGMTPLDTLPPTMMPTTTPDQEDFSFAFRKPSQFGLVPAGSADDTTDNNNWLNDVLKGIKGLTTAGVGVFGAVAAANSGSHGSNNVAGNQNQVSPNPPGSNSGSNGNNKKAANSILVPAIIGGTVLLAVTIVLAVSLKGGGNSVPAKA